MAKGFQKIGHWPSVIGQEIKAGFEGFYLAQADDPRP
jgi:hypothetical protein